MVNLYSNDSKSFKLESTVLPRQYEVKVRDIIILRNILTGHLIYLDFLSNILIDGIQATYESLRNLIYNFSCDCGTTGGTPDFKIFDYTFDNTFE